MKMNTGIFSRMLALLIIAMLTLNVSPLSAQDDKKGKKKDKTKEKIIPVNFQTVFTDDVNPMTGIAVSKKGRIFISYPNWGDSYKYALVEMYMDGSIRPYPNEFMNTWKSTEDGKSKWVCVQSLYIDEFDQMWVVDAANPQFKGVQGNGTKLVKIDLAGDRILETYTFEEVLGADSYISEVRVDNKEQYAYLTNSTTGGLLVLNLKTRKSNLVLSNHASVKSDKSYPFKIDEKEVKHDQGNLYIHSNALALNPDKEWLYYKPTTDNKLYRIKTKELMTKKPNDKKLAKKVKDLGFFNTSDGMVFDALGNLYMGDIEKKSIVRYSAKKFKKEILLTDERLIWPDSYTISHDGYLYITCSQIHKLPKFNGGEDKHKVPYTIYRLRL